MFKVNNGKTRAMREIFSELAFKHQNGVRVSCQTLEQRQSLFFDKGEGLQRLGYRFDVFIIDSEQI